MSLSLISFVGVDKFTDLNKLRLFKSDKMNYEFGVLFSDSKNEKHIRYPGYDFCQSFLDFSKENNIRSSLHLCGSSILGYLGEHSDIIKLANKAGRIQLNININKFPNVEKLGNDILRVATKYGHSIILQKNKIKADFNKIFTSKYDPESWLMSLSWLYDSSGGFGREIEKVEPPDDNIFTGYAGGIKPENVLKILKIIEDANVNDRYFYLDMESGVRENNYFSVEKCLKIKDLIENNV